mgnify:CR=1 FL=1
MRRGGQLLPPAWRHSHRARFGGLLLVRGTRSLRGLTRLPLGPGCDAEGCRNQTALRELLLRSPAPQRFVVNVSAMEGKFYRYKTPNHPHTNMAKAALNMMTRTAAAELAKAHRIFMSAVDTGWINDENPREVPTAHRGCVPHVLPVAESPSHATPRHPLPFPTIPCRPL